MQAGSLIRVLEHIYDSEPQGFILGAKGYFTQNGNFDEVVTFSPEDGAHYYNDYELQEV